MKIYAIHDTRANTYSSLMALQTDAHAVRSFTQEVNRADNGNMLNQFPADFALHSIGEFNEENGHITPHNEKLLEAIAAKRPAEPEPKRA